MTQVAKKSAHFTWLTSVRQWQERTTKIADEAFFDVLKFLKCYN